MLPNLPLAQYRFLFQATDPVSLPAFADPLWRSVFGLALRQLSCNTPGGNCGHCSRQDGCDYAALLHPTAHPRKNSGITVGMRGIPSPLIFHSAVRTYSPRIPAKAQFTMHMVLVGDQCDRIEAIIGAMVKAGQLGLGRKRAEFRLLEVTQIGPQPLPVIIMTNGRLHENGIPATPPLPEFTGIIRCTLVTPYLLPGNTRPEEGFDSVRYLMQVIRRIASLQQLYTDSPAEADFSHLKDLARQARITDTALTIEPEYSYSGNRKRFYAVRGSFILDLQKSMELWPWLWLGQWLHLPKLAGKGFGRYELAAVG